MLHIRRGLPSLNISIRVNGEAVELDVEPRRLLASVLRDDLGLTGTHIGCDTTNCGACTVLLDGKAVKSCTIFAVQADGKEVLTIEGLSGDGKMHPIQRAFLEKHGLQCGFCTPGMVMTAYWLLGQGRVLDEEEVKRMLSGNLCRCTGYEGILESMMYAQKLMGEEISR
jgi:carbon-monoxide dehydrogenase small subunit